MKWQIPDTDYIFGILHVVEIRPFAEEESEFSGLYKADGRVISIDAAQPEYLHPEIFCHEYAEGINDILDLGLKHYQICAIGVAFNDLIDQLKEPDER